MTKRVTQLAALSRKQDLYAPCVDPIYDPMDLALPQAMFNAKRIVEYILAQPVYLTEDNRYTGMLRFKGDLGDAPADFFHRRGHTEFNKAQKAFYAHNFVENLVVFAWQHSTPNYANIIDNGIEGVLAKIEVSRKQHRADQEKVDFLDAMEHVCNGLLAWSEKCAQAHEDAARTCTDLQRKEELLRLAAVCRRVPRKPAADFYEGLQSIIFCFQFLPDGVGTLDRTLNALYEKDIASGTMTREQAKEWLGEFYVHLSNHTPATSHLAQFSAECHFVVGGYTEQGEDGFTDLSRLMVETLMELDTRRPAISLRWTKKTPFEVLKFMLTCERNDPHKRFAFVNDEPRIEALMKISGFTFEDAIKYNMVGCNEPAFPGTVWFGALAANIARSITTTLFNRTEEAIACRNFEEFYQLYLEELTKDIDRILYYHDRFNDMRAKDINVLSAFLMDGCVENAKSPTQYGCEKKIGGFEAMGLICTIDSLSVIKQFVFDEKRIDMAYLIDVLRSNWEKDEDLRSEIFRTGRFFGNNDPLSNEIAQRFTSTLYELTKDRTVRNGAHILIGTLAGYNPYYIRFGELTEATPDGRYRGEGFMVGIGQSGGRDRNGLLSLLSSIAKMDPTRVMSGATVCNVMIDGVLMKNNEYFDKVCRMIEEYFKQGGIHIQLNYVTREELLEAQKTPDKYSNLRVRVSGYSANFVQLSDVHQTEIINRTVQKG